MSNKKNKIFKRKDTRLGVYTGTCEDKEIKIIDNGLYTTDDKKEIKFLNEDPEIIEYLMEEGNEDIDEDIDDKINDEEDQGEID